MKLESGSEIQLRIDALASGGDGIGRHEGVVVFVPGAAPGDHLRCRIDQVRRNFARAHWTEILEPGPGRRAPACRYADRCGGCDWLHLTEDVQSGARRAFIRDALERLGGFRDVPEIESLPSPKSLAYRALARVSLGPVGIGFRARRSHRVVDIDECVVLTAAAQQALEQLRQNPPSGSRSDVVIRGFGNDVVGLRASDSAFVQANQLLWERWPQRVAGLCGSGSLLIELYAGIGFFTAAVESNFEQVVAVERSGAARDLRHNTRATVHHVSSELFAATGFAKLEPDVVLLNPPRIGCDPSVIDAIAASPTRRVVYVSCDAATLARDLKRLGSDFELKEVVWVDALPQTSLTESIVQLDRILDDDVDS